MPPAEQPIKEVMVKNHQKPLPRTSRKLRYLRVKPIIIHRKPHKTTYIVGDGGTLNIAEQDVQVNSAGIASWLWKHTGQLHGAPVAKTPDFTSKDWKSIKSSCEANRTPLISLGLSSGSVPKGI